MSDNSAKKISPRHSPRLSDTSKKQASGVEIDALAHQATDDDDPEAAAFAAALAEHAERAAVADHLRRARTQSRADPEAHEPRGDR